MQGDIGNITHRFAKADNKYFANYNENEDSSCIIYLDVNNLYGWAIIQPLPVGKLSLLIHQNLKFKIISIKVLFLNVFTFILTIYMVHYECINLRQTNMLHVMIYRLIAKKWILNVTFLTIMLQNQFPNLHNKKNYVLYIENLNLYLSLGVKLGKVHRVLEFDQSPFLKDYIDFYTEKRKQANNSFKNIYNNAVLANQWKIYETDVM